MASRSRNTLLYVVQGCCATTCTFSSTVHVYQTLGSPRSTHRRVKCHHSRTMTSCLNVNALLRYGFVLMPDATAKREKVGGCASASCHLSTACPRQLQPQCHRLVLGLLGTAEQTRPPGGNETGLLTLRSVAGDGRGLTDMLVVTTTVRLSKMLARCDCENDKGAGLLT